MTITNRQLDAFLGFVRHGRSRVDPEGHWFRGNAYLRMIDRLVELGFWGKYDRYEKGRPSIMVEGPTPAGLSVWLNRDARRITPEDRAKAEARIAAYEAAESEWNAKQAEREAAEKVEREERRIARRAKRLAVFREFFAGESEGFRKAGNDKASDACLEFVLLDDDDLLRVIELIVDKETSL